MWELFPLIFRYVFVVAKDQSPRTYLHDWIVYDCIPQFPTVTICNKNIWTISTLLQSANDSGTYGMFEVLKDLYLHERPKPPPADKFVDKFY